MKVNHNGMVVNNECPDRHFNFFRLFLLLVERAILVPGSFWIADGSPQELPQAVDHVLLCFSVSLVLLPGDNAIEGILKLVVAGGLATGATACVAGASYLRNKCCFVLSAWASFLQFVDLTEYHHSIYISCLLTSFGCCLCRVGNIILPPIFLSVRAPMHVLKQIKPST